jgi:hypothetical protein
VITYKTVTLSLDI